MDKLKNRCMHPSACLFYFFMTAGVLIVASGSLMQHYFALKHPVFIPMHMEFEMYWDGGWDGGMDGGMNEGLNEGLDGDMSGDMNEDTGSPVAGDRYVWKEFPIYYIQDREDVSKVAEITFPQLEGAGEYWLTGYDEAGGLFQSYSGSMQDGRYQFKSLFVKMMLPAGSLGARGTTLSTMKVRYGDGSEEDVDIGQIVLTLDKPMEYVTVAGGSSSSDGTAMTRYLVQKDCRLEGFEVRNPEQVKREFKVTVDGTDIWEWAPVTLTKGDTFLVESAWHGTGDIREQFEPYAALIQWKCSDGSGGESWFTTNLDRQNSVDTDRFKQTYQYLKERGIKP